MAKPALVTIFAILLAAPAFAQDAPQRPSGPEVPADLKLYGEASLLMHRRDHAQALAALGKLLEEHPQTRMKVEARFFRAQCLEELGRREEAKAAFQALVAEHADSGWAQDAARRVRALSRPRPAGVVKNGGIQTFQLGNGDRISGRVVISGDEEIEIESDGFGRVVMPRNALTVVGRAGAPPAIASFAPKGDRQERIISLLAGDDGDTVIEVDDGETTVVEKDGVKTTTRVHKDGSKTVTTVTETKDGKKVVIERHIKDAGKKGDRKERRIELKFDDDDMDEHDLRDLPKKIRLKIRKHLDDLDEDLDLDLDDLDGLGERIRKQVHEHLEEGDGKHALEFLHELHGDDEDEDVFILKGDRLKKRLKGWKGQGDEWRKFSKVWKDKTGGWGVPDSHRGDHEVEIYAGGPGKGNTWFGDFGGNVFRSGGPKEDRVFLNNGDKISGTLVRVTDEHVEMKTSYGEVKIARDQVRQITFKRKAPTPTPHLGVFLTGENDKPGVEISGVVDGSAAEKAGLKEGDVIKSIGDAPVTNHETLRKAIGTHKVGDTVSIGVERDGKSIQLTATLAAASVRRRTVVRKRLAAPRAPRAPEAPGAPKIRKRVIMKRLPAPRDARPATGQPFLGISCDDKDGKVVVTGTIEGGAVEGMLEDGNVLTHFNGEAVTSSADLAKRVGALKPGAEVTLELRRGDGKLKLVVPLGSRPAKAAAPSAPKTRTLRKY